MADMEKVRAQKIKSFVQDVLGCGCAEEVFRTIELKPDVYGNTPYDRINIGNRLLVYIFRDLEPGFIRNELAGVARAGKKERDGAGFNRFRLALADVSPADRRTAKQMFEGLDFLDDRMYLHFVKKGQVEL